MEIRKKQNPETGSQIFECWEANQLIGYVSGKITGSLLEIESVWVNPNKRRRGVGTILLENLISYSHQKGVTDIQLEFLPEPNSDPEGARQLYKKFGLREDENFFRGTLERR